MYKESWELAYRKYGAEKHLEIHQIPICGNIQTFKERLEEVGYIFAYDAEHQICMKRQFNDHEVSLFILPTPLSKLVDLVMLKANVNDWEEAKQLYKEFIKILADKYGQPSEVCEEFEEPYKEGDGYELDALNMNMAHYYSNFYLPEGRISVEISNYDFEDEDTGVYDNKTEVGISYFDKNNIKLTSVEEMKQEANRN